MVRVSLLNIAAIATLLLGAEAGPCKPRTTAATSLAETTSSLAAETTATSIDTTAVTTVADTTTTNPGETTTTALPDTTTTDEAESTTTTEAGSTTAALAETTTTTEAESTTTTAAAGCVETQLFINPNFDDSTSDDIAPWTSNAYLTQNQPQSGTNALSATFSNGAPDYYIKQTLQNLNGKYKFSYYYRVVSVSQNADYVCNIQLSVGSVSTYGPMYDSVGGWTAGSVVLDMGDDTIAQADAQLGLTCYGEFTGIEVDIDTLAFTSVCGAA